MNFSCGACCAAQTASWALSDSFKLPVANTLLSALWLIMLVVLLVRMAVVYARGISQGYSLVQAPVEAIRKQRQEQHKRLYIPSFYFGYAIFNGVFMVIEVLVPTESPALGWSFRFLCGTREAFDVCLVIFVCLPRLTRVTKWLPLAGALVVCAVFSLWVVFAPDATLPCPWCTQHLPVSSVGWLFLIEAIACGILALLAWWRPFRESRNPRPAAVLLCGFWCPIYLALAITLSVLRSSYPASPDAAFCVNLVVITLYSVFYVPVLYVVMVRDALYVFENRLDDALLAPETRRLPDAETESLLRDYPISGMVDLIADQSLATIAYDELVVGEKLGFGGFGEVFRAEWNGTAVAVKSLLEFSHSQLESFVKEMQVLARLRHPNVLLILGMVLEQHHQCLVSEFCSGGSLHGYIHGHRLSWESKCVVARQVAAAMEYLHSQSVLHRDLKPDNILLIADTLSVRVCDFGLSRVLSRSLVSTAGCGTVLYSSPEMLLNDLNGKYCDVWSFGVVVWEMGAERLPYSEDERPLGAVVLGVVQGTLQLEVASYRPGMPEQLQDCVAACTARDYKVRPSFRELLRRFF